MKNKKRTTSTRKGIMNTSQQQQSQSDKKKSIKQPDDPLNNLCSLYVYTRLVETHYQKQEGKDITVSLHLDGLYLVNEKEETAAKIEWAVVEEKYPMPEVVKKYYEKALSKDN